MVTEKTTKKSLFDEVEEDHRKAKEEFDKLPPEEQKKRKEAMKSLTRKWDQQPWY